jgi:hypothetical protein
MCQRWWNGSLVLFNVTPKLSGPQMWCLLPFFVLVHLLMRQFLPPNPECGEAAVQLQREACDPLWKYSGSQFPFALQDERNR